jgi:hypothetical protein
MSEERAFTFTTQVVEAINLYREDVISLPKTAAEWNEIREGFKERPGHFPGAVGAIDGSLIRIKR